MTSHFRIAIAIFFLTPALGFAQSGGLLDLKKESADFLEHLQSEAFNLASCPTDLATMYSQLYSASPKDFDVALAKKQMVPIIKDLWKIRQELRNKLRGFIRQESTASLQVKRCADGVKHTMRAARYLEDYLGEVTLEVPQFDFAKNGKNKELRQSDIIGLNAAPHFLVNPDIPEVTLKSGDLIISRGNAFTSAAIARIGKVDAQFSHLALIYVKKDSRQKVFTLAEAKASPDVMVIEAHIEIGTTVRTFGEYLTDGNARLVFYKYQPDNLSEAEATEVAAAGAQYSFDLLEKIMAERRAKRLEAWDDPDYAHIRPPVAEQDVNDNVPYDFGMELGDTSEVFCSEWGYIAFESQDVVLPEFPTAIPTENALSSALGITVKETFAPGDMDAETRFQLMGEWRDFRKVRNLRHKDAILTKVFQWMESDHWKFEVSVIKEIEAIAGWLARQLDLAFTKESVPKNMTIEAIKTVFALDKVGEELQNYTENAEEIYRQENYGLLLPFSDMNQKLEEARIEFACKPWTPIHEIIGRTGLKVDTSKVCR